MFEIGRLCIKIAGRDAGKKCVIVEKIDNVHVLIDGETRRRKCNINHLEPLNKKLEVNDKASHDEIKAVFEKEGYSVRETKPKKAKPRLKKQHKKKEKPVKVPKEVKKKKTVAKKKDSTATTSEEPKETAKENVSAKKDAISAYAEKKD